MFTGNKQAMSNSYLKIALKTAVIIVLALNVLVLVSCGSSSKWSCKKSYVYVHMDKDYIKRHQQGADSFDKKVLAKKIKP